jgi:hypothetical protein
MSLEDKAFIIASIRMKIKNDKEAAKKSKK